MSWDNGAAWLGIGFIALPILIHLLGRRPARVLRFPTLRFLGATTVLPLRRTRVQDPLLLAVRIGILGAAVAAFAGPRLDEGGAADIGSTARVILVDTSRSMLRATPTGARAIDVAHQRADSFARGATIATTLDVGDLPRALPGASAWLARQGMRGEVVIVSDFSVLAVDSADVALIPEQFGVRLSRVAVSTDSATAPGPAAAGDATSDAISPVGSHAPTLFAAAGDSARLRATRSAAESLVPIAPPAISDSIAIAFPSSAQFEALRRASAPPRTAWMVDLVARLRRDSLLVDAAWLAPPDSLARSARTLAVAFATNDHVVVDAGVAPGASSRLVLFAAAPPGSVLAAALVAATRRATAPIAAPWEADRRVIDDRRLAAWQRPPSTERPSSVRHGDADASMGSSRLTRALWGLVLLLLGLETWLRRDRPRRMQTLIADDRAA